MARSNWRAAVTAALGLAACTGGEVPKGAATAQLANLPQAQASQVDPCSLLTVAEVQEVVGSSIERSELSQYGGTRVCNYYGPTIMPLATLALAGGMPALSSSSEMAAWRSKQAGSSSFADIKVIIEPVVGLGAPAIRNEAEGSGLVAIEVAVKGRLLVVTTTNLEHSKALAAKAIARMP
jgi:hypothetical protein